MYVRIFLYQSMQLSNWGVGWGGGVWGVGCGGGVCVWGGGVGGGGGGGARCQECFAKIVQNLLRNSSRIHSRRCVVPHQWKWNMTPSEEPPFTKQGLPLSWDLTYNEIMSSIGYKYVFPWHENWLQDRLSISHKPWQLICPEICNTLKWLNY